MAHGESLRKKLDGEAEPVAELVNDWRSARLEPIERTMLEFVEKLTLRPGEMNEKDVQALRSVGFVDEDILEIVLVSSYYGMVNRIAESLGAENDEEHIAGPVGQALPWHHIKN